MMGSPAKTTLVAPDALSFSAMVAAWVGSVVRLRVYDSVVGDAMLAWPAVSFLVSDAVSSANPGAGGSDVSLTTMNLRFCVWKAGSPAQMASLPFSLATRYPTVS